MLGPDGPDGYDRTGGGLTGEGHPSDDLPRWTRYVEVLGRPLAAVIAGAVVAFIGYQGQLVIQGQQSSRVYAEILSQREQAESGIRKDMFVALLDQFFADAPPDSTNIGDQLLRLEVLALNFSETLSLSPLFRQLDRKINEVGRYEGLLASLDRAEHRMRLKSLARRVSGWQLSRLAVEGETFGKDYRMEDLRGSPDTWMDSLALEGVPRKYQITVTRTDTLLETVDIQLLIRDVSSSDLPTARSFTLSHYDFPLIDNTRLSHDQRFAIVLSDFTPDHVRLEAVVFPGEYASQREASSIPALVEELQATGQATGRAR